MDKILAINTGNTSTKVGIFEDHKILNQEMIDDLRSLKYGKHSSSLGALIAYRIASRYGKKAYILDLVCVDELEPIARITGHPKIHKVSVFHILNQKSVARRALKEIGRRYEDLNLIVAHLGSGTSIGLHKKVK